MQVTNKLLWLAACKEIFNRGVFANLKPQIFYHFEEEERVVVFVKVFLLIFFPFLI